MLHYTESDADLDLEDDTVPVVKQDPLADDERLRGLASVYQTALTILASERVSVNVERDFHTPIAAWTSGVDITINASQLKSIDFDEVVRVHGLVFHELCHVRYTPRTGTTLAKTILDEWLMEPFNILEDQRIETLLTNRYPSTKPWLTSAILRWVIQDPSALATGTFYIHGRRFLPIEVRRMFWEHFGKGLRIDPVRVREIRREGVAIIDEYRTLVFPTDYARAESLVRAFNILLSELRAGGASGRDPHGHDHPHNGDPYPVSKGRPKGVKEQREDRDAGDDGPDEEFDDNVDGTPGSDDNDRDKSDSAESGSPEDAPSDADDETDDGDERVSAGAPDESNDETPADDHGQGAGASTNDRPSDPVQVLEDILDSILDNEDVVEEVKSTQRQIRGGSGVEVLDRASFTSLGKPEEFFSNQARQLQDVLNLLRSQADPGWDRRTDSGRVNATRWYTERDIETAYDRWDEGVHDAVDLEVVIMLDVSGSMGWAAGPSHQAMWSLKSALDRIDASTTVIAYDGVSRILYRANERASLGDVRYAYTGGGTNPVAGLNQAYRIFQHSKRANQILITLTDGWWNQSRDEFGVSSDEYIKKIQQMGVTTALGYIVSEQQIARDPEAVRRVLSDPEMNHGCQHAGVAMGRNLVPWIRTVVESTVRQRIRRAA